MIVVSNPKSNKRKKAANVISFSFSWFTDKYCYWTDTHSLIHFSNRKSKEQRRIWITKVAWDTGFIYIYIYIYQSIPTSDRIRNPTLFTLLYYTTLFRFFWLVQNVLLCHSLSLILIFSDTNFRKNGGNEGFFCTFRISACSLLENTKWDLGFHNLIPFLSWTNYYSTLWIIIL